MERVAAMEKRDSKEILTETQREVAEMEPQDGKEFLIETRRAGGYPSVRELFTGYQGDGAVEIEVQGTVGRELI